MFRSPFSSTLSINAKHKICRLVCEKALSTTSGLYSVDGGEEEKGRLSPTPTHNPRDRTPSRLKTKLYFFLADIQKKHDDYFPN